MQLERLKQIQVKCIYVNNSTENTNLSVTQLFTNLLHENNKMYKAEGVNRHRRASFLFFKNEEISQFLFSV